MFAPVVIRLSSPRASHPTRSTDPIAAACACPCAWTLTREARARRACVRPEPRRADGVCAPEGSRRVHELIDQSARGRGGPPRRGSPLPIYELLVPELPLPSAAEGRAAVGVRVSSWAIRGGTTGIGGGAGAGVEAATATIATGGTRSRLGVARGRGRRRLRATGSGCVQIPQQGAAQGRRTRQGTRQGQAEAPGSLGLAREEAPAQEAPLLLLVLVLVLLVVIIVVVVVVCRREAEEEGRVERRQNPRRNPREAPRHRHRARRQGRGPSRHQARASPDRAQQQQQQQPSLADDGKAGCIVSADGSHMTFFEEAEAGRRARGSGSRGPWAVTPRTPFAKRPMARGG